MTEAEVQEAIASLDEQLKGKSENTAILCGFELFEELSRMKLIKHEFFGVLGSDFGLQLVPAYRGTHLALASFEIERDAFEVGGHYP